MSCSLGLAYFTPTARALVKLQSTMGPAHPTQKAHIFLCRWAGMLWFQESPCNVSEMDNKSRSCGSMWSGCRVIPGMRLPLWNGEGTYKLTKGLQGLKSPLVVRSQELPAECCPETWSLGAARTGCYGWCLDRKARGSNSRGASQALNNRETTASLVTTSGQNKCPSS